MRRGEPLTGGAPGRYRHGVLVGMACALALAGTLWDARSSPPVVSGDPAGEIASLAGRNGVGPPPVALVARRAREHYAAGDLGRAIALFETLDRSRGLETIALETLAHYYGENQRYRKKHETLLRLADTHLNARDLREVLGYFRSRGARDEQRRALEALHARGFADEAELVELARLYRHEGRYVRALAVYERKIGEEMDRAGHDDVRIIVRLMEREGLSEGIPELLEPWIHAGIGREQRRERFELLLELGQFELVLRAASTRTLANETFLPFYRRALFELRGENRLYADAYVDDLLAELVVADGPAAQTRILHDLHATVPADLAHDLVLRSGYHDIDRATAIYYASLETEGRRTELAGHLLRDVDRPGKGLPDRLRTANRIASLDEFGLAERAFRKLAPIEGAGGTSMEGLMYSWSRLRRAPDIDWMGRQMIDAPPDRYDEWERRFLDAEKPGALLDWLEAHGDDGSAARLDVAGTRVRLAAWEEGTPRLLSQLSALVDSLTPADAVDPELLAIACDNGFRASVVRLAASLGGERAVPRRVALCIARVAGAQGRHHVAVARFREAGNARPLDVFADVAAYAAALAGAGDRSSARVEYERALTLLPASAESSPRQNVSRGHVLLELGDAAGATRAFERAHFHPSVAGADLATRKVLMELYLEAGEYEKVLQLGCPDDGCPDRTPTTSPTR